MRIVTRQIVASVSASVFGSLAVLGSALHGLPGLNHGCDCGCVYHSHCNDRPASQGPEPGLHGKSPGHSGHDCPICNFFALAKHAPAARPSILVDGRVAPLVVAAYQRLADTTHAPYTARGPPPGEPFFA